MYINIYWYGKMSVRVGYTRLWNTMQPMVLLIKSRALFMAWDVWCYTHNLTERTHREVWNEAMRIITFFLPSKYDFSFLETEFFVCLLFLTARERRKKHGFRLLECLPRGVGAAGRRRIKQRRTYFFCVHLFIHPFHQCTLSAYYVLERPALQKF